MTHPLLRKELRSLVPFLGLVLFFNLLTWGDILWTEFPDQYPLSKLLEADSEQFFIFVVAFALAASLLVREADDGTLNFLDALPVSRARIFCTKAGLALGVLWLMPLSDLVLRILLYSWSRTSLEPDLQWVPLLSRACLDAASCSVYLAIGLACSFLRRFSLLLLGLLICAYLVLREWQAPHLDLFNIFSLSDPVFRGRQWLWPSDKLAVQLGLGVVCLALAFLAFQMTGDSARRLADRVRRRRGMIVAGGIGTGFAVIVWFGLLVYWGSRQEDDHKEKVHYSSWSIARARTAHFQFLYPENRAATVAPLLDQADPAAEKLRRFLGAKPLPTIVADLNGSAPHTAGVAHWKQVRLDLNAAETTPDLIAIFAHETTHVLIDIESDDKVSDQFKSTRFFHEGLASYVEYHFFRPADQLPRLRRVAAAMAARHQLRLEQLLDDEALSRQYDPNLVYPLGEVFVHALVERYGPETPGKVLRAFARTNAPKDLAGAELWRDVLQSCGANLSEVEDYFFADLRRATIEHRDFIDALPRLRGAVDSVPGELVIYARHQGQAPGTIVCRLRPDEDTPERLYEYAIPEKSGVFRASQARYNRRTVYYQLGWRVPGASQPIYEPWVQATLKP